jgi:hypothetical protein
VLPLGRRSVDDVPLPTERPEREGHDPDRVNGGRSPGRERPTKKLVLEYVNETGSHFGGDAGADKAAVHALEQRQDGWEDDGSRAYPYRLLLGVLKSSDWDVPEPGTF